MRSACRLALCAAAFLSAACPAFAHGRWGWGGPGVVIESGPAYYPPYPAYPAYPAPVYPAPAYPAPVYPAPAYAPPPGYAAPMAAGPVTCSSGYNPLPMILGGVAGGAIGSTIGRGGGNAAAIVGGALLGGILGGQYGYQPQYCTQQVFAAAPINQPVTWYGPDQSQYYSFTPLHDFHENGRYCREYRSVSTIEGRREETYGTACRQPDGSWRIVN